jgi:hypothetical protein
MLGLLIGAFVALAGTDAALAHDTTGDSIVVEVNDQRATASAPVPFAELGYRDTSGDGLIDATELADQEANIAPTIVATVRDNVRLAIDGDDSLIIGAGVPLIGAVTDGDASAFVVLYLASGPHDGDVTEVALEWRFDSPSTEVVLAHPDGVTVGALSDDHTIDFSLGTWASATSFFGLGIEHIRFGPDHVLFLLVLTLTVAGSSVTKATAWRTLKLVTAFTLGHAVSLLLAYFDLVTVPAGLVEPAISLSIVAAAVLAIRGRSSDARPWIAAAIGLVHGLGFASSLSSLGVATTQQAPALAAFNLGIDVAQTAVVVIVLGALWASSKVLTNRMAWVTVPAASFAGVIGVVWTASRITGVAL